MITQILQTWPGTINENEHNTIPFKKVDEPNGWLGNMSRHPLRVPRAPGGTLYPTAEHYYQCLKFNDPQIQQEILAKNSPMSAKWVAKGKARDFPEKRAITSYNPADLDLMRQTIRLKLENHPNLRAQLLALPEDGIIIEDASARRGKSAGFWGMRLQGNIWTGENWLGRLWMELRLELANLGVITDKACTPQPA
jgi:predicted NAD-dependent protein-ADP-ribosyltransferase YbiA (DUF1768 family)